MRDKTVSGVCAENPTKLWLDNARLKVASYLFLQFLFDVDRLFEATKPNSSHFITFHQIKICC